MAAASLAGDEPPPSATTNFAAQARQVYLEARTLHENAPTNVAAAWHFARACFDWAEFATNDTQRAGLAHEGIEASRSLVASEPKLAVAHYYLALNLGQLARTESLGALKLVDEMEKQFKTAAELEPKLDHAGPDRCLGLLYRDAPGWPASLGSRSKARRHLQRAVELCPDFPENQLNLIESQLRWGERKLVKRELPRVAKLLTRARTTLTGDAWAASWADWDKRWEVVVAKAG
jgi:tetratricopeptide (TPR) repeat protein